MAADYHMLNSTCGLLVGQYLNMYVCIYIHTPKEYAPISTHSTGLLRNLHKIKQLCNALNCPVNSFMYQ